MQSAPRLREASIGSSSAGQAPYQFYLNPCHEERVHIEHLDALPAVGEVDCRAPLGRLFVHGCVGFDEVADKADSMRQEA